MAKKRVFGEIAGVPEGTIFENRKFLKAAGVHNEVQAGIAGSENEGAESIVVSGGYEDDEDFGELIIYTGSGGRAPNQRKQSFDQKLRGKNLALAKSSDLGLPVRVVRGYQAKSNFSPKAGYQYSGIYYVDDYWSETGTSGFIIWRYRLVKDQPTLVREEIGKYVNESHRAETTIQRIVRSTQVSNKVKEIYDFKCQVCGERLEGFSGPYAEAAHIKALGIPHNGPDVIENILCLCPNHHVLFDKGGLTINNDLTLNGYEGTLKVDIHHRVDVEYIKYHRGLWK